MSNPAEQPRPLTNQQRAQEWVDDIRLQPLDDTQALDVANVLALLALSETITKSTDRIVRAIGRTTKGS